MSTISTGTTLTTALVQTGDTTGDLVIKTNNGNTTAATFTTAGNLNIPTSGARITGDMSNGTHANRLSFQTSTLNGATSPFFIPNGTGSVASIVVANASDPTNSSFGQLVAVGNTDIRLNSGTLGTGTALPLTMYTGGSERLRIDTSGNVGIGISNPGTKLSVYNAGATDTRITVGNINAAIQIGTESSGVGFFGTSQTQPIYFYTSGAARMTVDASGNVGIGISSPATKLDVNGVMRSVATGNAGRVEATDTTSGGANITLNSTLNATGTPALQTQTNHPILFAPNNTEQARITSAGLLQFNSGYGSVATAFGCRAWVNFNGQGTVTIRGSGNVSSITDNGTGDYTVNFATAMPDANYATSWNSGMKNVVWGLPLFGGLSGLGTTNSQSTTQVRVLAVTPADAGEDNPQCSVAIFR
jgi:hypothetical protein